MFNLKRVRRGTPVLADDYNALVDFCEELAAGPKVVAPLASLSGAIYLADDFELWDAITTGTVTARTGAQMGSGPAKLLIPSVTGALQDAPGFNTITAWNNTGGAVPEGVRGYVRMVKGLWRLVESDCSGVA